MGAYVTGIHAQYSLEALGISKSLEIEMRERELSYEDELAFLARVIRVAWIKERTREN